MLKFSKRRALVVGAVASVALSAVAFAYFTSSGNGEGTATVGTSTAFVVTTSPATGASLLPGFGTQTVAYQVNNPSSGNQNVANTRISVANNDGTEWTAVPGCSASDFSLNGAAAGTAVDDTDANGDLAGGATANGSVTVQMINKPTSQDGCKNVTVPLYVAAS